MEYIVLDIDSLHKLRDDKVLKESIRKIKVITGNVERSNLFEKRLNKQYFACGCAEGQFAVWCTILGLGLLWVIDRNSDLLVWWKILSCVFASALLGKLAGMMFNHRLLQQTYSELEMWLTHA